MILESIIILAVVLVISYFCARTGRRGTGIAILALTISPAANLLGAWLAPYLAGLWGGIFQWRLLLIVVGLVAQGALLGAISRGIQKKTVRRAYLAVCGGFAGIIAFAMILKMLILL